MTDWQRLKDVKPLLERVQAHNAATQAASKSQEEQATAEPSPSTSPSPLQPPQQPVAPAVPDAHKAVAAAAAAAAKQKAANKAGKHARTPNGDHHHHGVAARAKEVKNLLLGWLPARAPPRELIKRGILKSEALTRSSQQHHDPAAPSPQDVFGGELEHVLKREDTGPDGLPRVVTALMARLRENDYEGLRSEGIFRIPGDQGEVFEMKRRINEGADPAELAAGCQNLNSVAGLLKLFYREIQPPLFTFELYDQFISCSANMGRGDDDDFDPSELIGLLAKLPAGHQLMIKHLMAFLREVPKFSETSKMSVGNTAAVFAPNLIRPEIQTIEHLADASHTVNLIILVMNHWPVIFGETGVDEDGKVEDGGGWRGCGRRRQHELRRGTSWRRRG